MIKFAANGPKGRMVGLGITRANVLKLQEGQPIAFDGHELGLDAEIMIWYGRNESELIKQIQPFLDSDTKVLPEDS